MTVAKGQKIRLRGQWRGHCEGVQKKRKAGQRDIHCRPTTPHSPLIPSGLVSLATFFVFLLNETLPGGRSSKRCSMVALRSAGALQRFLQLP